MKSIKWFLSLVLIGCLTACGNGNSTNGVAQGATVSVKAEAKSGTSTIFYANYSSANSPSASFTLTSKLNSNVTSATASDVSISSEQITYEYIGSTQSGYTPSAALLPITYYSNLIVPKGGTEDWENVPIWNFRQDAYNGLTSGQNAQYTVRVKFNGVETNGSEVKPETTFTLYLVR